MEKYVSTPGVDDDPQKVIERVLLSTRAAQIGTWDLDLNSKTVIWDAAMYRLHGISPEHFKGAYAAWLATLHPEDRMRITREIQQAVKGTKEFDTDFRVIWPDGSVHYIRSIAVVENDPAKKGLRMIGTNWDITESKVANQQLESINRELNIFLDTINEIFFSIDMINGRVIRVSNACEHLYGYKADDFYSNHLLWLQIIHPEDQHIVEKEDEILRQGKQVFNQKRIVCKDNSLKWVETRIVPSLDQHGVLIRVDGVSRDISISKKAEEELRKSQELYRKIVETSQEGIWMLDENSRTIFVNQRMCDMLGYTISEMMGKKNLDFKDEEGKILAEQQIERRKLGIYETHDSTYITKNGDRVWGSVSTNPIFDENGKYVGVMAMITDITKRKADEESLKKSEANLRAIVNNTSVVYIQLDSDFTIVSFNEPAKQLVKTYFGQELKEGSDPLAYYPDDRKPFILEVMNRLRRGETVEYEVNFHEVNNISDPNASKWFVVRYTPILDNDKKTHGYILSMNDITGSKNAAMERAKMTSDLIQRNNDLEQFTYIVSHNLRAPVAAIIGLSDILTEGDISETDKKEVLESLSVSTRNLDSVILDMNHILHVREQVNELKETVYFEKLLSEITTSISNTIEKEKVVFDCDFAEAEQLFTLRSSLYSIFHNLILNSIKYRQKGLAPLITIRSGKTSDKVRLIFSDNGKGLDLRKYKADLFGLYKRFDTSVEGKGMGLFIVKTQVDALGGIVTVKSEEGQGTTFVIELPV